jgi:serine/threonine protein kinase
VQVDGESGIKISILNDVGENSGHWLSLIMSSLQSLFSKYRGLSVTGGSRLGILGPDNLCLKASSLEHPLSDGPSTAAEVMVVGQLVRSSSGAVFKILEEIGSGGFGVVYKAEVQTEGESHGIKRALKFPVTSIASPQSVSAQLQRERNVISLLLEDCKDPDPPIIKAFDVDHCDTATGLPFVEFELGCGCFLSALTGTHPLAGATVVKLGEKIAKALDFVHQRGKIHADVKPENILLAGEGMDIEDVAALVDAANCKLIDFGLCMDNNEMISVPARGTSSHQPPMPIKKK